MERVLYEPFGNPSAPDGVINRHGSAKQLLVARQQGSGVLGLEEIRSQEPVPQRISGL